MEHTPVRSSRGMSLVAVLVAVAVLGIVAAGLSILYDNMSDMMGRSTTVTDAKSVTELVRNVMTQQELCVEAFTNANITWTGSGARAINKLTVTIAGKNVDLVTTGQAIGKNLRVKDILLQPPADSTGKHIAAAPASDYSGGSPLEARKSYAANLTIEFDVPVTGRLFGGVIQPANIPITVGTTAATGRVVDCPSGDLILKNADCGSQLGGDPNCQPVTGCTPRFWVSGFSSGGVPKCECDLICDPPKPQPSPSPPFFGYKFSGGSGGGGN